jgi:hypothetical protein
MSLALEPDYQQEQNMSLKPRSGRLVLGVMLRREDSLSLQLCLPHFRRPHTEV